MKNNHEQKKPGNGNKQEAPAAKEAGPGDYLRALREHLRNGRTKEAFVIMQQASVRFPGEPIILSYFGCLQAMVDKKYRSGIETCKKALALLEGRENIDSDKYYPLFYLNLGRAYLAAGKKEEALNAYKSGLKYDRSYSELRKELRRLGVRKEPPVSFLSRANPINKYIGLLLHKDGKGPGQGRTRGR